ncbi:hypothetical protein IM40_05825 [Candidatus Paracaedimonas acanthamoebae]|nr:hypothetical protein IM40_05825 [Candidatus Paracaedimonas acanthamoebae]
MRMKKVITYLAYTATILSISEFANATDNKNGFKESLEKGAQNCKNYDKYIELKQEKYAHQLDEVQMQVIQRKMDALDSKACEMKYTLNTMNAYKDLKK